MHAIHIFLNVVGVAGIVVRVLSLLVQSSVVADVRPILGTTAAARLKHDPDAHPTGSRRWWVEMDRQGRGRRG